MIDQLGTKDTAISTEQLAHMTAVANELGEFFSQEPNREKMLLWLDVMRRELVEECDPIGHPELRHELDTIDRVLDRIEARRSEVRCPARRQGRVVVG
jgi:hypothetical protein